MATSEPEDQDDSATPKRVRVPIRRADSIFSFDEHADVEVENAGQWDARLWHDRPPR
ncbi:hypothetical protein [Mycolicibacterium palauense]|uniref:hypothetical protein n=1 Tax=Mycolicibacterium palauense TaxID=2034511 RepID=UPI00159BEC99|nr:hypothetical protein [Mycolicibacterium palauense]